MNKGETMGKDVYSEIYNATIDVVLAGFEPDDFDAVSDGYRNYLRKNYDFSILSSITSSNYDKILGAYIMTEKRSWSNMLLDTKKGELFLDENLIKLSGLSAKAEGYARVRITNGEFITREVADDLISSMEEAFKKVEPYNLNLAEQYLSEGSVDCDFASGISNNCSIRLSSERENRKK